MKKETGGYAAWLAAAAGLYFFENGTGTRIILLSSLLLPLVPSLRRAWTGRDSARKKTDTFLRERTVFLPGEEADSGEVRIYQPGDPVNRIHWKLSARRQETLLRIPEQEEAENPVTRPEPEKNRPARRKKPCRKWMRGTAAALAGLLLLFLLPGVRLSAAALANRIFEASEAANRYLYPRFSGTEGQSLLPAAAILAAAWLLGAALCWGARSRGPALCFLAGCAALQAWFGLALPAWGNGILFSAFALRMMHPPRTRRTVISLLAGAAAAALAVTLFWPGTDPATEAASERVRDALSSLTGQMAGGAAGMPAGEHETRHAQNRSLAPGNREAGNAGEFRPETRTEEQISRPRWMDWLRTCLLLTGTAAVTVLPFTPFVILNRKRRKALEAREALAVIPASEAVCGAFQQAVSWLEATGRGAGNLPYAEWTETVAGTVSPEYADRFGRCAKLFEKAAYSRHSLGEPDREQALGLLEETERTLQALADRKQRLRLKYREWLWI